MQKRVDPLPPLPDRHPYLRITVQGTEYVLKAPSLRKIAEMLHKLPEEERHQFMALAETASSGAALFAALAHWPDQFALLAAAVGLCWADPLLELQGEPWVGGSILTYGNAVYDELDEAGWGTRHMADAVLIVAGQLMRENALDASVMERAAFFRLPRGNSSESESQSSAGSSAATADAGSTN